MITTEMVLDKINEMKAENSKLWEKFEEAQKNNQYEYDYEDHGGDFIAGGYDGDSLSHMLDILTEQNYILGKLENYIKKNQEPKIEKTNCCFSVYAVNQEMTNASKFVGADSYEDAVRKAQEFEFEGYKQIYIREEKEYVYTEL